MRVILAEDHNVIREALKKLLEEDTTIQVVGEAKNGKEAIEIANRLIPDLILMDISMPTLSGIEATRRIKKKNPKAKILILSMYDDETYIKQVLSAGAEGYLLKETLVKNLFSAIRIITNGGIYLDNKISEQLLKRYTINKTKKEVETIYDTLSAKEKEILKLIGEGLSSKEIANLLNRSVKTIETHRSNIMKKLSIHKVTNLVRYAIKKGL